MFGTKYSPLALYYHDNEGQHVCNECAEEKNYDKLKSIHISIDWGEGIICDLCGVVIREAIEEEEDEE